MIRIVFFLLFFLSFLFILLSKIPFFAPLNSFVTSVFVPFEKVAHSFFTISEAEEMAQLKDENRKLLKKLVDQKALERENEALKDQFQTNKLQNKNLLPAEVIGAPGFVPSVSEPEYLVIDKGSHDGVVRGQVVVSKDNVIGKIAKTAESLSVVELLRSSKVPITAKTLGTNALGIVNGEGLSLENVMTSETLQEDDLVVTKGDIDANGGGYPPDLIIGKIIAVDKKPSALFQSAKLRSFVDISKLTKVFVIRK